MEPDAAPAAEPDADLDADQERVLAALLAMQRLSWEQGVTGQALLALGLRAPAAVVARDAVVRQRPDGRLAEVDGAGLVNGGSVVEVVRRVAAERGDPALAEAADRQVRWLREGCPRAGDGTLFHLEGGRQVWVDSVYMVVPALTAAGFVDEAAAQMEGHRRRLLDERTGLWAARWDEDEGRLVAPQAWGTGNGWVVAGVARALHHLGGAAGAGALAPAAEHARAVLDACLAHRRDDGLFGDVVDDPASFAEANLAQMLACGALTGVADGWLPQRYAAVGRSLVATARAHVDADGLVTPVSGAPHFDRPGTSAEAQAFFLLATAAERRLDALEAERPRTGRPAP